MCYRLLPCHLSALEYSIKPTICSLALVQPALSRLPGARLLELSQPRNQHFQQELNDIIEPGGGTAAAAGDDDASFWGCSGICSKAGYSAIGQFRAQLAATSKWYHSGAHMIARLRCSGRFTFPVRKLGMVGVVSEPLSKWDNQQSPRTSSSVRLHRKAPSDSCPTPKKVHRRTTGEESRYAATATGTLLADTYLLLMVAVLWLVLQKIGPKPKPKVVYAKRYSNEFKFRPAASPNITEMLKDGRKRLRGAAPTTSKPPLPKPIRSKTKKGKTRSGKKKQVVGKKVKGKGK
ncbi:hypothetical protein B0H19DRAFT_1238831 [Mycena capillaripes]|nr:hypothetical protein B0H19DRAFT_1238831 [Mycena capillaripes]